MTEQDKIEEQEKSKYSKEELDLGKCDLDLSEEEDDEIDELKDKEAQQEENE